MLLFLTPAVANATHAAVQLVSNTTRVGRVRPPRPLAHVRGVRRRAPSSGVAACGADHPGGIRSRRIGTYLLGGPIGVFVLVVTWMPSAGAGPGASRTEPGRRWGHSAGGHDETSKTDRRRRLRCSCFAEGADQSRVVVGPGRGLSPAFSGPIVGATGPVHGAPLFLRVGLLKEGLIGTKAACQAWVHLLKLGSCSLWWAASSTCSRTFRGSPSSFSGCSGDGGDLRRPASSWRRYPPGCSSSAFRVILTVIGAKLLLWDGLYSAPGDAAARCSVRGRGCRILETTGENVVFS